MYILYIHQYFATPYGTTGTRSYEFAKRWVLAGHRIIMLTSASQLSDEDLQVSKGRFIKKLIIEGIDVRAINLPYNQKMGFVMRVLSFIAFFVLSSFYILFTKRPDVIYATSTPLTVGIPALVTKWLRRIPFVFEVRDQWPEIPIEMGIIRNKLLIKILLWLEKTIYKNSSAIVALSPGMAEGVKKVIGSEKSITVIPNSCDIALFNPDIDGSEIRKKYNWDDKIVFLHAGAMGKANSLNFVIETAQRLKEHRDILFVLIGDGKEKTFLKSKVTELGLKNIEILPLVPKCKLPEYFAAADIGLVIIGKYPIIEHNGANKFFDSLSAGKLVLINYSGWQREVLEQNNAGFGCRQYDVDEFVERVLYISTHRGRLVEMSRNARLIAEKKFNRNKLAQEALEIVTAAKGERQIQ